MANQVKNERLTVVAVVIAYLLVLSGVAAIFGVVVSHGIENKVSADIARIQRLTSTTPRDTLSAVSADHFSLKFTTAKYSGNLGGADKADAACNTEYPGYHFCTEAVINAAGGSLPDSVAYANPFEGGWVNPQDPTRGSCNSWQSESSSDKGSRFYANGSTASRWWIMSELDKSCDTPLPLCCYK